MTSSIGGTQNQSKNKRKNRNQPPDEVEVPILPKSGEILRKTNSYKIK